MMELPDMSHLTQEEIDQIRKVMMKLEEDQGSGKKEEPSLGHVKEDTKR